jgi:hypothetical protein
MRAAPLLLLLLLAACPETVGQQCPARTVSAGQFSLAFAGQHDAGECTASPPDAAAPFTLALDDGGVRGATICVGTAADGGPLLYLAVPTKGARPSDLLLDGGFHFTGSTAPTSGTVCGCPIAIDETFSGFLLGTPAGGPFTLQPDGGLPLITGLTGTLTDQLSSPADAGTCFCNVPCPVSYSISGSRF